MSSEFPVLQTKRLRLRQFELSDAADVQRFAGDKSVADTTLNIPHPYEDGMAEKWIKTHREQFEKGESITFAIVDRQKGFLVGAIGLGISKAYERAELGYWIAEPFWDMGYCSEAGHAVLQYAFNVLGLNRVHASHLTRNPASGRVMQKLGMMHEGCRRQHVKKWGKFEDMEVYGILRNEYSPPAEREDG